MLSLAKKRRKKKNKAGMVVAILVLCIIGVASYFAALKLLGNTQSTNNRKAPDIKDVTQAPSGDKKDESKDENKDKEDGKKPAEKPVEETKEDENKEDEVKEDQPPEETVKPNSAYAEEVVNNFSVLYPITVNSGGTIEVLEQLIIKDSDFYNEIKKQLDSYKKDNTTINFTSFLIQDTNYLGNQQFDIKVSQELEETKAGKSNTKKQTAVYRVIVSKNKIGIISVKVN